ncbi:MAG: hypothetical protein ONB43_06345 [candidate division KSB1 bacterium]|nr:hypothetical protein [candidate division KSB1 bacterium]MDZ7403475.1 hypothetical protein [candidate division KSB1 bacterium]
MAAPILLALFEALVKPAENRWFVQPLHVERRQVCSVSGMPASEFCVSRKDGLFLPGVSPHYPQCTKVVSGKGPVIHSPSAGTEYKIRPGVDLKYQKSLLDASVSNQTKKIYWFMNRKLIFSGKPTASVFITPLPGTHRLVCMDDEGCASEVEVVIN